jgi:glutathione S-transferase
MALTLHFHPLSSFCQKALMALYENAIPFEKQLVNLGDAASRGAFERLWPIGKMPVLHDTEGDRTVPEASIIIEYLAHYYPGKVELVPRDPELAILARLEDRFYDLYVNVPVGKIVTDRLRPAGKSDSQGVEEARALLAKAYARIEQQLRDRRWAVGAEFTLADCAAAPALFFADKLLPCAGRAPQTAAYLERLRARPSFARALAEAEPYLSLFPN